MKVLGVVGSPRKGGNTDILVDKVLEGVKDIGAETIDKILLPDYNVEPCTSCYTCLTKDETECVLDDDMGKIYEKMLQADCLVLGTPLYWYSCTAQFKAFMDRWIATMDTKYNSSLTGKGGLLVTAYEEARAADPARFLIQQMQHSFHFIKMRFVGTVQASAFDAGEVRNDEKALSEAYEMGRSLKNLCKK